MERFVSKNILYLIVIVFLAAMGIQIYTTIWQNEKEQNKMALEHSRVLADYAMANRIYYQNLYLKGIIPLTKDTLKGLPAYSSSIISKKFSDINKQHIEVKTVSDNPRNIKNMADKYELLAIKNFKNNPQKKEYFKDFGKFYEYAIPLKIKPSCLSCHGKTDDAPEFIRENYKKAYGYKVGDIRGVLSIKIPKFHMQKYFSKLISFEIIKNIILFTILLAFILYISKKNGRFNKILEELVIKKTKKLQEQEEHILYLSRHDELTGLPNRTCLKEDIKTCDIGKMAYINIDDFKNINDFYGIKAGDIILKEYASYLKGLAKTYGLSVYKLPSDEFALFYHKNIEDELFLANIKKIISKLNKKEFVINSQKITLSSTVGISFEKEQIMSKTDIALKKAKKENIGIGIYSKDDNIELQIKHNICMVDKIKKAIDNDKIIPYYQAIYNIKTTNITKYESLARIIDEEGTVISPYSFLEISKKARLYNNITKSIVSKTFISAQKYPHLSFSINLSVTDMQNEDTVSFIKKSLKNLNNPHKIVFEILESESIENYKSINAFISGLKNTGCKFAIDDFGSGYSNFAHLVELDIDFIKIDASLIKNIHKDTKSYEIVKTIVEFAKIINAQTIAEYVESKEILDKITYLGIDYAQGYYIAKPQEKLP